jgi:hypothetical protein
METQLSSGTLKTGVTRVGKIGIVVLAISIGFFAGEFYHKLKTDNKPKTNYGREVNELKETSILINEKNELIIENLKSGTTRKYEYAVARVILRRYALLMASDASSK